MPKSPVILVTGASQGIGAAIAKVFAQEIPGVRLALVARSEKNLQKVAKMCEKAGATAKVFPCDVGDDASVATMAEAVNRTFKGVDVLINNAGKFYAAPLMEMTVADFDRIVAANLRSVFLVTKAFLGGMLNRGRGDIFNMSSVAGLIVFPGGSAYSAAKFGVTGLTKVMRAELKDKGIRVCAVYPGATISPSWAGSGIPGERMMPPEDVARAFFDVYRMSRRTVVEEIILRPQLGDF